MLRRILKTAFCLVVISFLFSLTSFAGETPPDIQSSSWWGPIGDLYFLYLVWLGWITPVI